MRVGLHPLSRVLHLLCLQVLLVLPVSAQVTFRKAIGNPGEDIANCVRQTTDGGYVICGVTSSADELSSNIYLLKTDETGNLLWSRNFGSSLSVDVGSKVVVLETGELLVVGFTNAGGINGYDALLLKTDSNGFEIWRKTFGGSDWDFGQDVIVLPNGNYGVAGSTFSFGAGGSDGYFLEISPDGDVVHETTVGTTSDEEFKSLAYMDGRLYFCGSISQIGAGTDALMYCTDMAGNEVWQQVWGGIEEDFLTSVISTSDGNIVALGTSSSNETVNKQLYFIKATSDGQTLFERSDGGPADEEGREIVEGVDGNYTAVGYSTSYGAGGSAVFLFTISSHGWWVLSRQYGSIQEEQGNSIAFTQDGGFILAGFTYGFGAINSDVFLLKTDGEGLTGETGEVVHVTDSLLNSIIHPAANDVSIRMVQSSDQLVLSTKHVSGYLKAELYDLSGSLLQASSAMNAQVVMDTRSVPNGVFIVRVTDSLGTFTRRIGIVR